MVLRFIGFGAAKCATTWTYRVLKTHPEVSFPAGKEVNYWSHPSARSATWYSRRMADDDPAVIAGDISPTYTLLPKRRIAELRSSYPDVRLFFNVRNPVDRIWSRSKQLIREAGLDLESMTLDELGPFVFRNRNFAIGEYATVLDRWLAVFPAEQVLLSQFEVLTREPEHYFERLCGHIGIDVAPLTIDPALEKRHGSGPERKMPESFRHIYDQLYAEPMRRFRDVYGIDYT